MRILLLLLSAGLTLQLRAGEAFPAPHAAGEEETAATDSARDDAVSRKVLGSSVVTSVSVIMDTGAEQLYLDAVGKPQAKPPAGAHVASPINLLSPDRYEFYTFSDAGDLVKRLMTLAEIQGIIANADGEAFNHNAHSPEKKVNDVVSNVQSVLRGALETGGAHNATGGAVLDTPDVSASWSAILPAIFGNSGEEVTPARPPTGMTPETIVLEHHRPPTTYRPSTRRASTTTTKKPSKASTTRRVTVKATTPTTAIPRITTRGTRPNRRPTTTPTTTTTTTSTTPRPTELPDALEGDQPTTTVSSVAEASSHFIQLFDPVQSIQPPKVPTAHTAAPTMRPVPVRTTARTPSASATYSTLGHPPTSTDGGRNPAGALFIVDEKTNTRIPITSKDQLATLLNHLEATTSASDEGFKNASALASEPLIILNSVSGLQTPNISVPPLSAQDLDDVATTNVETVQSTTSVATAGDAFDADKYEQLLLTSTNIYEINKELAESTTARPLVRISATMGGPTTAKPIVTTLAGAGSTNQQVSDILSSTLKEPNLVNSIEQLLQQAVGNVQEVQKTTHAASTTTTTATTIPKVATTRITPPTTTVRTITTTPALTTTPVLVTTTDPTTTEEGATQAPALSGSDLEGFSDDLLLNEAMGSLLSQVVGSDFQALTTTLQDLPSTTTELLDKPFGENLEYRIKTTDIFSETTEAVTTVPTTTANTGGEELLTTEGKTTAFDALAESKIADLLHPETEATYSTKYGSTIEILKTDATSYSRPPGANSITAMVTATDQPDSDVTTVTEATPEGTTEDLPIKDLPVVFDLRLHGFADESVTAEDGPATTEVQASSVDHSTTSVDSGGVEGEATLERLTTEATTIKPAPGTTENATESPSNLVEEKLEDSDSLASTNSYKEVTSNAADSDLEAETADEGATSTDLKREASTLSIEELIRELTTKEAQNAPDVPKETTVLIITKPLYSTTPTTSTTTTTTTTTTAIPLRATSEVPDSTSEPNVDTTEEVTTLLTEPEPQWTIVSTIAPHNTTESNATKANSISPTATEIKLPQPAKPVNLTAMPQLSGLEETTKHLDQDIYQFVALCNELAFGFWRSVTASVSAARSVVLSPFAATSLLAMVFLGARGATSGEMNEILRLDDMVTFNPHLIFKNVSESIEAARNEGVATSVILRELYSDRAKGHLLNFYKERAKAFYDGHVEEVSFKEIGDTIRRRTNLIVRKQTDGKIAEYIRDASITVRSPLAGVSASIFQTDCSDASMEGRDGELYFVVLPSIRQRRLVPVPAAVWRANFLAGYDPALDATAVALGGKQQTVSAIFVIPGQQGIAAPGDGLARLERSLVGGAVKDRAWPRLLATLVPRAGLEVQLPRFQHRSVINATVALQQMGMRDLFDAAKADLRGLNGVANDLYLSDILQVNSFATCGEQPIRAGAHHTEIYPATANRTYRRSRTFSELRAPPAGVLHYDAELSEEPRDYQRAFHDPLHDPRLYALPLPLRPRQARLPDPPRLRFDRPFLYFVRHNPTGLIVHMGRFNPRLLP